MSKFNCTMAKDFLHEAARVRRECLANTSTSACDESCPLMCDFLEKNSYRCARHCTITDEIFLYMTDVEFGKLVKRLQQWSDSHREARELSGDEIAVLTGLKLLGYRYIAEDKCGSVFAYVDKPYKTEWDEWKETAASESAVCVSYTGMFEGITDFSDDEPLEIEKLLKEEENGNA